MNIRELLNRVFFRMHGRIVHLRPEGNKRGDVLISYITLPYLDTSPRSLSAHTNRWESTAIAEAFRRRGFGVDLIDIANTSFIPRKKYNFFIDNGTNLERLSSALGAECVKIFHATTAHWKFNNDSEQERLNELFKRRGIRLAPDRPLAPNRAAQLCDRMTLLGNSFTESTYADAGKHIVKIPISTTHTFDSPENKNFEAARKNFVWFGGAGVVHKGLDLVLEAFAQMPEYTLSICGKLDGESDFKKVYERELALPNIRTLGFTDPASSEFKTLCDTTLGLIYPSCSEGQSGAVVLCMHAGLIPIISMQSGVDAGGNGSILTENTIDEIRKQIEIWSSAPALSLKENATGAWQYARQHYTREAFRKAYENFVGTLV